MCTTHEVGVLVLDGDPAHRDILVKLRREPGLNVLCPGSAEDAIDLLQNGAVNVMLLVSSLSDDEVKAILQAAENQVPFPRCVIYRQANEASWWADHPRYNRIHPIDDAWTPEQFVRCVERAVRAQLAECLGAEREKWYSFLNNSPMQCLIIDRDERIEYVNRDRPSARAQVGQTMPYLLSLLDEQSAQTIRNAMDNVWKYGKPESWLVYSADSSIWYFGQISPLYQGDKITRLIIGLRDQTKQVETEEALRRSEENLARSQRLAQLGNWQWNFATDEMVWSDEMYRFAGIPQDRKMTYQIFFETIYPEDRETFQRIVDQALAERGVASAEYRIVRPDGEVRHVFVQGQVIFDAQEHPIGAYGTAQDITERKKSDEALRKSEADLTRAQHLAHLGNWQWDIRTHVLTWSDETYRVFGIPLHTPLTYEAFFQTVHPDDRERFQQMVERIMASNDILSIEYRIVRPDGEVRYIFGQGQSIRDAKGDLIGSYGAIQDITERKKVEEALRKSEADLARAQQLAHMGSWQWDIETNRMTWSDETYRMFGIPIDTPISYEALLQTIHPDDRERFRQAVDRIAVSEEVVDVEYRIIRPDGQLRYIFGQGQALLDAKGKPILPYGTVQDITDRKKAEEALRKSEADLVRAQRLAHLGNWQQDIRTNEMIWSDETYRIFDVPPGKPVSLDDIFQRTHPDDREPLRRAIEQGVAEGYMTPLEHRIVRSDGEIRFIAVQGEILLDSQGVPVRAFGAVQDITERRKTERALRESEQRLQIAKEAAALGIFDCDTVSNIIRWDARIRELWGVEPDEPLNFDTFMGGVHPDDREAVQAAVDKAIDPQGDGRYSTEHRVIHRASGEVRWVLENGQVFFQQGRAVRLVGIAQDVTERKNIEEALRESEQRLLMAKEAAALGIWDCDPIADSVQWDARMREFWGVGPDEPINYTVVVCGVHPDDRPAVQAAIDRAIDPKEDGRYYAEHRVISRSTGRMRWLVVTGQTFFEQDRAVRMVGTAQDITKRKQFEEALRESEQRLLMAKEAAALGIYDADIAANTAQWDTRLREFWDIGPDEPISYETYLAGIHPDDRAAVQEAMNKALHPAGDGRFYTEHRVINRSTGVTRWMMGTGQVFFKQGRAARIVGTSQDITKRKQFEEALRESEQRLQIAKEAASLGIYDYDMVTNRIQWDARVHELWGIGPDEPITYETVLSGLHPDDREMNRILMGRVSDPSGNGRYYAEYRVIHRVDGVTRWIASTGQVFFEQDRAVRLVGTVQDISERKEAEQTLLESQQRLQIAKEAAVLGIYDYDILADQVQWDARVHEFWGVEPGEPITYATFMNGVHPDDRAATQEAVDRAFDPAGDGRFYAEYRVIGRSSGHTRWIAATGQVFFEQDRAVRLVGTVQDITQRRQNEETLRISEENLARAQRLAHLGNWERDFLTGEMIWSDEVYRILGIPPRTPVTYEDFCNAIHPDDRIPFQRTVERAVTTRTGGNLEYRIIRPDGQIRHVHIQGHVILDSHGSPPIRSFGTIQDITERKKTEEALRRSEEDLVRAQHLAHLGNWHWNLDTNIMTCSEEMYRVFGIPKGTPKTYDDFYGLIHPDDREQFLQTVERIMAERGVGGVEFRIVRADGEIRHIFDQGKVVTDAHGKPIEVYGTIQDITERKITEEALRKSEENLVRAQRLAHLGSWECDLQNNFAMIWSEETYRILDIPPGKPVTVDDVLQRIHPDDKEWGRQFLKQWLIDGQRNHIEHRIVLPSGEIRHLFVQGHIRLDPQGVPIRAFGAVQDITDRKKIEQALRNSEENLARAQRLAHLGSWECDLTDYAMTWSEETYRIYGIPPEKPVSMDDVLQRVHSDDKKRVERFIEQSLIDGKMKTLEHRIMRPDGATRYLFVQGQIVFNPQGVPIRSFGAVQDITDRKEAEELLRLREFELAHAARLSTMGEIAGQLAHEINQPLYVITNYAAASQRIIRGLFEEGGETPARYEELLETLSQIGGQAHFAAEIVHRLRGFIGNKEGKRTVCDVEEIFHDVAKLLEIDLRKNQTDLTFSAARRLPRVRVDRILVQQVLVNLIRNAIDAMKDVPPDRRAIEVEASLAPKKQVHLRVRDRGKGMSPEQQERIFEPFYSTKANGLGLGLSICQSSIKLHGGKLWVEDSGPEGTIFGFSLPAADSSSKKNSR